MIKFIKYLLSILIGIILYYILSNIIEKFNIGVPYCIIEKNGSDNTQELVPSPNFGDNLQVALNYLSELSDEPDYTDDENITYHVAYYPDDDPTAEPQIVNISGSNISNNQVIATFKVVNADDSLKHMHKTVYTSSMWNGRPREFTYPDGSTYHKVHFDRPMSLVTTGESCENYWCHNWFRDDMDHNGYTTNPRARGRIERIERGKKVWLKVEDLQDMIDSSQLEQFRKLSDEFTRLIEQWHDTNAGLGRCVIIPTTEDRLLSNLPECDTGYLRLPNLRLKYDLNTNRLVFDRDGEMQIQSNLEAFQRFLIQHYQDNPNNPLEGFPLEQYVDYPIFTRDQEGLLDFRFLELTYKMSVSQMLCQNVGVPLGNTMYLLGDRVFGMTETDLRTDLFNGNVPDFFHIGLFGFINVYMDNINELNDIYADSMDMLNEFIRVFDNNQLLTNEFYTNLMTMLLQKQRDILRMYDESLSGGEQISDELFKIYSFLSRQENWLRLDKCLKKYNLFVQCLDAHNYKFVLLFRIFYWFDIDCEFAFAQITEGERNGQIYVGNFDWDLAPPMWAFALNGFTTDITAQQLLDLNFTYMNRLLERLINNQIFGHDITTNPLFVFLTNFQIQDINYTDMFTRLDVSLNDIIQMLCNIWDDYSNQIRLGQNIIMIKRLYQGLIYNGLFLLVYVNYKDIYRFEIEATEMYWGFANELIITDGDGTQISNATLVFNVLNLPIIPRQFIYLITELFREYEVLFLENFDIPNPDDFRVCELVVANPIGILTKLTIIPEEPAQEPEQELAPESESPGVTVRTSVCGAEFRF